MADKQREPKPRKKRDPKIFVTVTFEPDLQAQVDLFLYVLNLPLGPDDQREGVEPNTVGEDGHKEVRAETWNE